VPLRVQLISAPRAEFSHLRSADFARTAAFLFDRLNRVGHAADRTERRQGRINRGSLPFEARDDFAEAGSRSHWIRRATGDRPATPPRFGPAGILLGMCATNVRSESRATRRCFRAKRTQVLFWHLQPCSVSEPKLGYDFGLDSREGSPAPARRKQRACAKRTCELIEQG